jgi:LemA protein
MSGLILAAALVLLILWGILTYNRLVSRRNLVAEGWSGVDAQLKRRADLVPNLVTTVKGYATHERQALEEVTRIRTSQSASADPATRAAAEQQLDAAVGRLMAVAESYPDLKASANFQELQRQLGETEDQIQLARRYYNGAVRDFNVMIQQLPSNLIARLGGFQLAQFFELDKEGDRATPQISFS